jgi:hypothetical protein
MVVGQKGDRYADLVQFLVRPFQLLATPICALVALYASFCYGILYMMLGMFAFPNVVC